MSVEPRRAASGEVGTDVTQVVLGRGVRFTRVRGESDPLTARFGVRPQSICRPDVQWHDEEMGDDPHPGRSAHLAPLHVGVRLAAYAADEVRATTLCSGPPIGRCTTEGQSIRGECGQFADPGND